MPERKRIVLDCVYAHACADACICVETEVSFSYGSSGTAHLVFLKQDLFSLCLAKQVRLTGP